MEKTGFDNLPTTLIIFGATGDLATRKLFPSLYNLAKENKLPNMFSVIAHGRREYDTESFLVLLRSNLEQRFADFFEEGAWERFAQSLVYFKGDLDEHKSFERLAESINDVDNHFGVCTHKIFYLSVSPDLYSRVIRGIKTTELNQICQNRHDTKIIVEKPFGSDLQSFRSLNKELWSEFAEDQIYRLDHYLGKETVQNILYFKVANTIIINDLNAKQIESIEIKVYETLGVEERATYYDSYGQLRDMLQSHGLQLLTLILLRVPASLAMTDIIEAKLSALKMINKASILSARKGQYIDGVIQGKEVVAYNRENGLSKKTKTETLVNIELLLRHRPWKGVKVHLKLGKRLAQKQTQIVVNFKEAQKIPEFTGTDKLIFNLQPEEGITVHFQVKKPGKNELQTAKMIFKYEDEFENMLPDAHESLLLDIISRRKSNFLSTEELEESWKFVDKIRRKWKKERTLLEYYKAGSMDMVE